MKRIVLFLITNLAVMLVLSVVLNLLGANRFLTANGLDIGTLLVFSAVIGFGGSIISLLMSKPMAKWSTGAQVITGNEGPTERWLVSTVQQLAQKAGIGMPEVAMYEGEPNAFATGAFKNSALVAVSTGLLQSMNKDEVEAVLGHEIAHVTNGDMVTLTLIQGVVNTFVVFFARIVGYFVDKVVLRNERDGVGIGFYVAEHGVRDRLRHPRLDHRRLVLAPARIPRRCRFGQTARQPAADDPRAGPPGRSGTRCAAAIDGGLGHQRPARLDGAVLQPPADRRAHPRAAGRSRLIGEPIERRVAQILRGADAKTPTHKRRRFYM